MISNWKLYRLPSKLKMVLLAFLILQCAGVIFGLTHLMLSTEFSVSGTSTLYRGDEPSLDDLEIQEHFPKPISELFLTTHNHLLGFSFLFGFIVTIFFFSSTLPDRWKHFLMIEPFISVLITFLSIWALRLLSPLFVYMTMIFGFLTYASYFLMLTLICYELVFRSSEKDDSITE